MAKTLPQGTDKTPEVLTGALKGLPDKYVYQLHVVDFMVESILQKRNFLFVYRWKNYIIRGIFTFIMISGFCLIIYGGPLALMITVS